MRGEGAGCCDARRSHRSDPPLISVPLNPVLRKQQETSRRAAKSVDVKVQIAVKDASAAKTLADAIKIADVNRELTKQGLKRAEFTKPPKVLALALRWQIE